MENPKKSQLFVAKKVNAKFLSFYELLSKSDFVIICCDLNDSTRNLFNAETFSRMKEGAILVNTSRFFLLLNFVLIWQF